MKKNLLSLIVILALTIGLANKSTAQTLGVNLLSAGDTIWNWPIPCQVPDTAQLYFYGTAGGYLPTDSILINISFGDGTDTTYLTPIYQSYFYGNFTHVYTLPGIYSLQFIATGPDGSADTIVQNNAVLVASQCGNISGKVYLDANSDCLFNIGDTEMQWYQVRLWYNGSVLQTAYTDANGNYAFSVPTGFNFTIDVVHPNLNVTTACPVSGSYAVTTLPATNMDFGLSCSQAGFDLTGTMSGWGVRQNVQTTFYFGYWNTSCTASGGTVTITLPTGVTFVSGVPAPTTVNGNVLTYNVALFNFFGMGTYNYNTLTVLGDANLVIGDTLCFDMVIDPQVGDLNPADNIIQCCVPVRNSCDPNEKMEAIAGFGTANILPGTELDYTVFFQNVGNDVAYNINVVDQLSNDLDAGTFKIISASHPMKIYAATNGVMKYEFTNINLAAASVNEPLSHGFVRYKISAKANLPQGTSIENKADIFFDFNSAITTNSVFDVIDLTLGINNNSSVNVINFYPNPAHESFIIRLGNNKSATLKIVDATGNVVINQVIHDGELVSVNEFASGVYSLKITSNELNYNSKLMLMK